MQFLTKLKQLFLLAGILLLFPLAAQSQDIAAKTINLSISNATLETAFAEIERQSGMTFVYGDDINRYSSARVNILADNISVKDAITRTLAGTNLLYTQQGANVMIHEQKPAAITQSPTRQSAARGQGSVSGTVSDEGGQPLIGALVLVPGTITATTAGVDGKYTLNNVPAGTTKIQFSFMGYETLEVADVRITANRSTPLDVVLKEAANQIESVVVTANYNVANTAGVLAMQQHMPQVASVISAQQIGRTSDKNLGEALKRVTGISTMDNKYVVVRGMGERWNEASLDGVTLPSTEANAKAFSFDLIPTNIIDNVAVVKSPTPDMNASFAGGFVQITTKAIPEENFFNISIGGTWNSVSTGKTQIGRERGQYDWLGFDDGRRTMPKNLMPLAAEYDSWHDRKIAQTHRFADMGDNFSLHESRTPLANNIQFSVGRVWNPKKRPEDRLGFVGSISYRNTQQTTIVEHQGRSAWSDYVEDPESEFSNAYNFRNQGNIYKYGTVLSGILNGGWQRGTSRVNFRNMYTRKYDNDLHFVTGWDNNNPYPELIAPGQKHYNAPTFQDLLQNKLDGERMLGKVKLNWDLAHTWVHRNQKDAIDTRAAGDYVDGELFFQNYLDYGNGNMGSSRGHYESNERDFNWGASAELPFDIGRHFHTTAKLGYMGAYKNNTFLFEKVYFANLSPRPYEEEDYRNGSLAYKTNPFQMTANGHYWYMTDYGGGAGGEAYDASVTQHAPYLMLDHRWDKVVRLVWGVKAENYKYDERANNPYGKGDDDQAFNPYIKNSQDDKKWLFLPSVNLTVTPFDNFNIRLGYNRSVIRPHFMERGFFRMYDPALDGYTFSQGVNSTTVDGADFKIEWFPGAGEIISAGAFYRYLDQPIERIRRDLSSVNDYFYLQNQKSAKSWGFEFELRKNFAFIADVGVLRNLYLTGNATITKSEVQEYRYTSSNGELAAQEAGSPRPLYGQTPLIYNVGLSYEGERLGLNVAMNHTARKVNMVTAFQADQIEYEAPSTLLDAQISWTFPRQGLTLKLSASNLLDSKSIFYWNNRNDYDVEQIVGVGNASTLKPGKSENYEKHDPVIYQTRSGRSVSLSASWTF